MVQNSKMKKLLEKQKSDKENYIKFKSNNLSKLLFPNFIVFHDCVLIADDMTHYSEESISNHLNNYTSKTQYEADRNETLINYFLDDSDLHASDIVPIALDIIKIWSLSLKKAEPDNRFCFIISCSRKLVTIRFHKLRESEPSWLSDDLEDFNQPVAYVVI